MAATAAERPLITIIIPMKNEERYIKACMESVKHQDYPLDQLELLIVDGMSTDRCREIVQEYSKGHPWVKLLDNPHGRQNAALNIGIRASKAKYILRMDAHTEYASDYVSLCVYYLEKTGAENVGGPYVAHAGGKTLMARCISAMISHALVMGGSPFRVAPRPRYCDSCVFGAWHRDLFEQVGYFNETLARGEDNEFNSRIMRYGAKIFMTPAIKLKYYARATLGGLLRQAFSDGYWHVLTMVANPWAFKFRYGAPFFFDLWLIIFGILSVFHTVFLAPLLFAAGLYTILLAVVAVQLAWREDWRLLFYAPPCVLAYHVTYGLGSFPGIVRFLIFGRRDRELARLGSRLPDPEHPPRLGQNVVPIEQVLES